jgi:hypothetical protein
MMHLINDYLSHHPAGVLATIAGVGIAAALLMIYFPGLRGLS